MGVSVCQWRIQDFSFGNNRWKWKQLDKRGVAEPHEALEKDDEPGDTFCPFWWYNRDSHIPFW